MAGNKVAKQQIANDQGRRTQHGAASRRLGHSGHTAAAASATTSCWLARGRTTHAALRRRPDEVHRNAIAKTELGKYASRWICQR